MNINKNETIIKKTKYLIELNCFVKSAKDNKIKNYLDENSSKISQKEIMELLKYSAKQASENWFFELIDRFEDKSLQSYSTGLPVIFSAVLGGNYNILNKVIDVTGDINVIDDLDGWTALHESVNGQKHYMTKLLLERGIDYNIKSNSGKTALDIAKHNNFTQSVDIIETQIAKEEKEEFKKNMNKQEKNTLKL